MNGSEGGFSLENNHYLFDYRMPAFHGKFVMGHRAGG